MISIDKRPVIRVMGVVRSICGKVGIIIILVAPWVLIIEIRVKIVLIA